MKWKQKSFKFACFNKHDTRTIRDTIPIYYLNEAMHALLDDVACTVG